MYCNLVVMFKKVEFVTLPLLTINARAVTQNKFVLKIATHFRQKNKGKI
jgi:hypothetical protein